MVVEPITISGKGQAPQAQARLPAGNKNAQKGGSNVKAEKQQDVSRVSGTVANVQKNLGMIHGVDLQFTVDKPTGDVMVTVKDESTGEVIREIPPAEVLNLAARLDAMVGLIFDQKG
ncbi:MAG: flagellar protein FlaG [Deltaproteobacteria bacterium]|nr:flagellar protein FlaG [Deltaproteobacteria bacterium]